ncbi:hypothetical protein LOR_71c19810 [Legionella oakridgensis RV-2-2007]|nr:hypothetical protein LOR_71c19810 [Legionella oakridgensis RV-2-2007]
MFMLCNQRSAYTDEKTNRKRFFNVSNELPSEQHNTSLISAPGFGEEPPCAQTTIE